MKNIVVLNFAGSVGKTTITKQLICPFLGNVERIQIESINSAATGADVEMNARQFKQLAKKLASPTQNQVIDIGGSNIESVLQQMAQMEHIETDIDFWVIPVDERGKVITDTLNTINHLVNVLGVTPSRIVVIANSIEFPEDMPFSLALDFKAAKLIGFHFSDAAVVKSDLFDIVKDDARTIVQIAEEQSDLKAAIVAEKDKDKRDQLAESLVHRRMARFIARNLRGVWASTPMCTDIAGLVKEHALA